jgi:hypothetical protein
MSTGFNRGDVFWIIGEINKVELSIKAGNRDRYVAGYRIALLATTSRLLRISRDDLDRYLSWVAKEVESGKRIGSLEEPAVWIRKNAE